MKKSNAAFATFIDQKYQPLEMKYKLVFAAIILLLPIVVCFFFFFRPNSQKITNLSQQQHTLEQQLQRVKMKLRDKPKLQRELAQTTAIFQESSKLLPKEKEIPKLLADISSLGRNSGLDFNSFKPMADIPKDFYDEIPIDIDVNGPYHNVGYFLDQISKLDRIVTVSNIKMGSPKRQDNEMLLNSFCKLVTYRYTNIQHSKRKSRKR